ncbi:hypothetical protein [Proteus vulgaris]|uniref:Uncharacterized protein n=1 Tax=Proteus vulgaris TaxID=585 RepID=A0A6G6SKH9_PROVU|nr:hypothetical protein [Proteus vulgaris]QIF95033.1 hypothetical protein GTH24_14490 [Proteus vulgaris]WIF71315.1 hypothetical protein QN092_15210 [Proteus vulgaris]CRL66255.1 hypothetical protein BN1805_04072 [Proteus vulgaris]
MRYPPRYPEFSQDKPINWKKLLKWMLILIGLSLFFTNVVSSNSKVENKYFILISSIFIPIFVSSFLFLIYLFLKTLNNHNNNLFKKQFDDDNKKWWLYHSASIPIKDAIIIGSLGENQHKWHQVLKIRPVSPLPIIEDGQERIPCSALIGDKKNREEMMAKLLADHFINGEKNNINNIKIDSIYWKGSQRSLNKFIEHLKENHISPPLKTTFINSINSLDIIIDNYYLYYKPEHYNLVGGSNIFDDINEGKLSETGFLWTIFPDKEAYNLHRCEISNSESNNELSSQIIKYSGMEKLPEINISINTQASYAFLSTPLYSADNIVQDYFGDSTYSSPFIAISFAVLHCMDNDINSCGWISGYYNNQYIAGVILKDENQ